jgi:hypothetical protein
VQLPRHSRGQGAMKLDIVVNKYLNIFSLKFKDLYIIKSKQESKQSTRGIYPSICHADTVELEVQTDSTKQNKKTLLSLRSEK